MSTSAVLVRWCAGCAADAEFEQPGCVDGHETDCPEWVCVSCGDAVLIGFTLQAAVFTHPTSHVA